MDIHKLEGYESDNLSYYYLGSPTTKVGCSFMGTGGKITEVGFKLARTSFITGTVVASLYAHTGTYGTSSKGTGDPIETSESIDISTIPIVAETGIIPFTFSGNTTLVDETPYVVVVEVTSGNANNSNRIIYVIADNPGGHSGNPCGYNTSTGLWTSLTDGEIYFLIRGTLKALVVGEKYALPPFRRA